MLPASPQRFDGARIDHREAAVAVSRWRYIHLTASTLQVFIFNIFPLPCVEKKTYRRGSWVYYEVLIRGRVFFFFKR